MLGYDIGKDGVTVNPEKAELVREIFRRFIDGESMNAIAADLNERGITGVFDGRWTPQRLRQLLANEKYTGNALLWKHFRNNHIEKKKTVNRGELPMFYAEETHPRLLTQQPSQRQRPDWMRSPPRQPNGPGPRDALSPG